jgi:hypothetical protein
VHILLSLASFDEKTTDDAVIPGLSHETIAGMVGTTRSLVCFFMKRFKELGFIDYKYPNDPIRIHRSLIAFQAQGPSLRTARFLEGHTLRCVTRCGREIRIAFQANAARDSAAVLH